MKFATVLFFSIILVSANEISARKVPEDYWKEVMKDEPIPEAINVIIDGETPNSSEKKTFWSHFKRDFDVTSNVIIYHPHQQSNHLPSSSFVEATSKPEAYGGDHQKKLGNSYPKYVI